MMFLDTGKIYNEYNKFIDLCVGIASCVLAFAMLYFIKRAFLATLKIIFLSLIAMSVIFLGQILLSDFAIKEVQTNARTTQNPNPNFSIFSKDNPNIIIFMLDAFTGSHFKILQEENPSLNTMLDGFTYYDNTTTASSFTHTSLPSVFGVDYYSSYQINARNVPDLESERDNAIINIASNFLQKGFRADFDIYAVNDTRITEMLKSPHFSMQTNNAYYKERFKENHNFDLDEILAQIKGDLNGGFLAILWDF